MPLLLYRNIQSTVIPYKNYPVGISHVPIPPHAFHTHIQLAIQFVSPMPEEHFSSMPIGFIPLHVRRRPMCLPPFLVGLPPLVSSSHHFYPNVHQYTNCTSRILISQSTLTIAWRRDTSLFSQSHLPTETACSPLPCLLHQNKPHSVSISIERYRPYLNSFAHQPRVLDRQSRPAILQRLSHVSC